MAKDTNIIFRIDSDLKKSVTKIAQARGLTLTDIENIKDELTKKTGRNIDIVTAPKEELDPMFYNIIKKDEICIYER